MLSNKKTKASAFSGGWVCLGWTPALHAGNQRSSTLLSSISTSIARFIGGKPVNAPVDCTAYLSGFIPMGYPRICASSWGSESLQSCTNCSFSSVEERYFYKVDADGSIPSRCII